VSRRRTLVALLLAAAAVIFYRLPPRPLFSDPLSAVLLARDGSLLGARIAADGQWRFPGQQRVPERFAQALITYEDKRFYNHPGIDPLALARALRLDLRRGHVVSGGSTISMQLARLVRNGAHPDAPRSLTAKFQEMVLALRLELAWSKPQLLALYVDHAPFGGNVVGLEAAAWRYFGRADDQLSWAEAATLAVLPNSPSLVNPGRRRAVLQRRRDALLQRLAARGVIGPLDLQLALAEPLVAGPRPLPELAPHLLETLRRRYPQQQRFQSTLDAELQSHAVQIVHDQTEMLRAQGIGNAAALVIDNRSFEVLAYVGNADGDSGERALAVDIVQRPRSSGSILKPLLYAAMLDAGQLLPKMLVPDIPTQYQGFAPENFDRAFRGAVPADEALAHSLNVPAVRLLRDYGYPRFYDLLTHLGVSTLREPPDHYGLALILGGAEVTLWDVARMYANLADLARQGDAGPSGGYRDPQVLQGSARRLPGRAEISTGAAWLTLDALLEVPRPADEANWKSFAGSHRIAWKTGTSWGLRDAWAVGSTSRYTVGVWAGNANGAGVPGLTGSQAAAPLLFALFNRLPAAEWFEQPTRAMKRVSVCSDDGFLATADCPAEQQWVPADSHFDRQSPNHLLVHVDAAGRRVDSRCESVASMQHLSWLVLPPAQEYFYRRGHAAYRELPPWRVDCRASPADAEGRPPLDFLYPDAAGKIYVPVELDGRAGRVVFEAVHRDPRAVLYWHVDERYVGRTSTIHQLSVALESGMHTVTIVDAAGNRASRSIEVLPRKPR
jgi:penicillin-binding protein 1C